MTEVAMLLGALLFPVLGLGMLLWLTHLEETLPSDVEASRRRPAPPPILAIPVRRTVVATVAVPEQRQAFSRSATLSFGGSTNR